MIESSIKQKDRLHFGMYLIDGFSLLAFSSFIEVFRQISDYDPEVYNSRVRIWNLNAILGEGSVSSAGFAVFHDETDEPEIPQMDFVVLVGGRIRNGNRKSIGTVVKRFRSRGTVVIAIDTAVFDIAHAGLFREKRFCIHWVHHNDFLDEFPGVDSTSNSIFVVDGEFLSCAGGTWAADLGLYLAAEIFRSLEVERIVSIMGLDMLRQGSHLQKPLSIGSTIRDSSVQKCIRMIERNMSRPPTIAQMAEHCCLSIRQVERRFVRETGRNPMDLSRFIRLKVGRSLLFDTDRSIAAISSDCGFSDQSHFTRHFRKEFGLTPYAYRQSRNKNSQEA